MAHSYYGFSISSGGTASTGAYYYVTLSSNSGIYDGAAVTLYPTNTSASYFNYRSSSLQWQSPAARVSAGATVVTSETSIRGVIGVSPAINVDLTLVCYGNGGTIGTVVLKSGQTEAPFDFAVDPADALDEGGGAAFMQKTTPRPEPVD